jgi:uncharacterized membrane protein YfcA
MVDILIYLIIGLCAGILSGLIGIGGGIIIIPILVLLLGFTQHEAQGTTLALMVPPVGILAAWTYYKHGHVNLPVACFICIGFLFGGLIGAKIATGITGPILQKIFGGALFLVSLRMIFFK